MTYYTTTAVDTALAGAEIEDEWGDLYSGWRTMYEANRGTTREVSFDGEQVTVTLADKYEEGENDGYGADVWLVVRVGDQFFRKGGYTSSYDGETFDGACTEVHAVTKIVTVYE